MRSKVSLKPRLRRLGWTAVLTSAIASLLPVPSADAQTFAYVTDEGSNSVSQFSVIGGKLSPLKPATVAADSFPLKLVISPDASSVYVTNFGGTTVNQYSVGQSGALTPKTPASVAAGRNPEGIAISPDGKSVYVTEPFESVIHQYKVGRGGTLTPDTPATVATGPGPTSVAVSPDGRSVYVTSQDASTVSQYNVGPGGVLSPMSTAAVATGDLPFNVVVTPDGRHVYTANLINTISEFDVGADGALTPVLPALQLTTPAEPVAIAVSPDGAGLYEADDGGLSTPQPPEYVSQFTITASGALVPKTPLTVPAGVEPFAVALTPDGKNAFVANFAGEEAGTVSQYTVGAGGALTAQVPPSVAVLNGPAGIVLTPSQSVATTMTTVRCSPSVLAPGDVTVCKATVSDVGNGVQSRPSGTVRFSNSAGSGFLGNPCTLSGPGESASCVVLFASLRSEGLGITASYSGDATHEASHGSTIVLVRPPPTTTGCVAFGRGKIVAADGDRAHFWGLATAGPARGLSSTATGDRSIRSASYPAVWTRCPAMPVPAPRACSAKHGSTEPTEPSIASTSRPR